jgi:carboxymethylenebutenolidase
MTRRQFTALSIAAGVSTAAGAAGAGGAAGADAREVDVVDVEVRTAAGSCDAALAKPSDGQWPAVILFPDAFGLRPTMRDMARRLAQDGYTVLVPNPYYRSARAPGIPPGFNFEDAADRQKLAALRAPLTSDAVMQDAKAYVAFLDTQPSVHKTAKMGVVGYCMGGPMTLQAAAAVPARVGAGASFHGGGLVTDKPDSPHRLVSQIRAQYYFGIAANDDAKQPEAKTALHRAFEVAGLPAKIEVYAGCLHGWCIKDMPLIDGKVIYNEAEAERAWHELLALYRRAAV